MPAARRHRALVSAVLLSAASGGFLPEFAIASVTATGNVLPAPPVGGGNVAGLKISLLKTTSLLFPARTSG